VSSSRRKPEAPVRPVARGGRVTAWTWGFDKRPTGGSREGDYRNIEGGEMDPGESGGVDYNYG